MPTAVQRPLILVYDGSSSNYYGEIVLDSVRLKIILVLLPANATNLMQPLHVAVFKPFKATIDAVMREQNLNGCEGSITRKIAIRLVSTAWTKAIMDKPANGITSFTACERWPVSLPQQQRRLKLFWDGGCVKDVELPSWLKVGDIMQIEILVLPASSPNDRKRRKPLNANLRLFKREDLQNIDV
uniref:Uncharacterized protein AlNc14C114G6490 n=1 Tax=Albugo laibachii Nc14 TaxID=890382 RepID=F0WIV5_9STRA|nr:conserved hypothetical protein [Albugo laibachii Nc14]|eukprot:CCA21199.1 conserved hypothetical protein [Albugo laibachii Nc14]